MDYQLLAAQLRKPEGDFGIEVGEQMNLFNREINLRTITLLNIEENEKVLEIGTGNGLFCKEVLKSNNSCTYTGVDYSELMVKEAFFKNQDWVDLKRADFMWAEASNLPFPDHYFHKIFSVNTLYFMENPERELSEIKRLLKPGGLAIISIRDKDSVQALPVTPYGFQLYNEDDLRKLLLKGGFSNVNILKEKDPEIIIEETPLSYNSLYGMCWK